MSLKPLSFFLLVFLFAVTAFSATDEKKAPRREDEDDRLSIQFGFYHQNDGPQDLGGNPFLDERETVYETIIVLDKTITERDQLNVRFLGDIVSSASIAKYNNPTYRALQSYPSGNKHGEVGVGWQHKFDAFSLGGNASFAYETSQFYSGGYGLNFAMPFNSDNSTLTAALQGYTDTFQDKLFTGVNVGYQQRQTITLDLGFTQVLTPTTVGNLNYSHTSQFGFLSTTYQSVFVNGVEFSEAMPDTRQRDATTMRIKQALSEWNSIEGGYRYYHDSWGINANTFDLRFLQYLWGKKMYVEPSYRFYTQDAANFYAVEFNQLQPYRTSDPDLSAFNGQDVGIRVTFIEPSFLPFWKADLDLTYHYYFRSDHLDYQWTTAGYTVKF